MKTTLNLCDDLYRRAKAQAALEGKPVGRLMEESLEMRLQKVPGAILVEALAQDPPPITQGGGEGSQAGGGSAGFPQD